MSLDIIHALYLYFILMLFPTLFVPLLLDVTRFSLKIAIPVSALYYVMIATIGDIAIGAYFIPVVYVGFVCMCYLPWHHVTEEITHYFEDKRVERAERRYEREAQRQYHRAEEPYGEQHQQHRNQQKWKEDAQKFRQNHKQQSQHQDHKQQGQQNDEAENLRREKERYRKEAEEARKRAQEAESAAKRAREQGQDHRTPQEILGLGPSFTQAELKKAWAKKAKEWHPDNLADKAPELAKIAEEEMKKINGAYAILRASNK